MSEAVQGELQGWGEVLVSLSRGRPARCDLLLRLRGVSPYGPEKTVPLSFERESYWWVENVAHAEVAPNEVMLHDADGQETRLARLLLSKMREGLSTIARAGTARESAVDGEVV